MSVIAQKVINLSSRKFHVDRVCPGEEMTKVLGKIQVIFWILKNPEFSKVPFLIFVCSYNVAILSYLESLVI